MSAKDTTDEFSLNAAVAELKSLILAIKAREAFFDTQVTAEELANATDKATNLFMLLKAIPRKHKINGLETFLDEAISITKQLHGVAANEKKRFPPPNQYMRQLTVAFESFANHIGTKEMRDRLRQAATFVPVIDGVVSACGGIPYYFEFADRHEKVAMVLSAVLLVVALAMTIAVFSSPAIAAVPFLYPAITSCVLASRVLYDQAAKNAKQKYADKPIVMATEEKLAKMSRSMQDLKKSGKFAAHINSDLETIAETDERMHDFIDDTFGRFQQRQTASRTKIPNEPRPLKPSEVRAREKNKMQKKQDS